MIYQLTAAKLLEDDDSTSSTMTVKVMNKPLNLCVDTDDQSIASTVSCSSSSTTKSVRFNTDDNVEYANTQLCKEETKELWCTSADYKAFRAHTTALAREVQKAEAKNRAPFSYQRVLLRTYEVCSDSVVETQRSLLSYDERKHLRRWSEVAQSRLGLERWAVRAIGKDRSLRRAEIVDVVLDLQELYHTEGLEEHIREHAERLSRPSRLFARHMAEASAEALMNQEAAYYLKY